MSQNTNHPLDQHFREHLEGHSSSLPPHLEERIMERVRKSPSSRSSSFWMERAAMILFLCTVGLFQAPDLRQHLLLPEEAARLSPASAPQLQAEESPSSALPELSQLPKPGWNRLPSTPDPGLEAARAATLPEARPNGDKQVPSLAQNPRGPAAKDLPSPIAEAPRPENSPDESPAEPKAHSNPKLAMVIKMPSEGYFAEERSPGASTQEEQKWWRYANHQFQRILRGDKPQLPAWKSEAFLAFNLPSKSSIFKLQQ